METIARAWNGTREIMGRKYPVTNVLYRIGPRKWVIAWSLCNGVPSDSTTYKTRRDAVADLHAHVYPGEGLAGIFPRRRNNPAVTI